MTNEIQEILARLKNNDFERDCNDGSCYKELYLSEIETLLDYITNLQEERSMYKVSFEEMSKNYFEEQSRIDKATEYMEHYIEVEDAPINERIKIEFKEVLNKLKGEENEN